MHHDRPDEDLRGGEPVRLTPPPPPFPGAAQIPPPPPHVVGPPPARDVATHSTHRAARSRRSRRALVPAGIVALAVTAGAGGGWFAAEHTTARTVTVAAPATASTGASASFGGQSLSVASVVDELGGSVVAVDSHIVQQMGPFSQEGEAAGTGIVFDGSGHIVTNAHVVDGATSITVTLAGETAARKATVVSVDATHDVAVLRVGDTTGLKPATFATSDVHVGDQVVAVGNALALKGGMTVTQGIVSAIDRSIQTDESSQLTGLIQTDAPISSGNSGGPLMNAAGEVVGMNTAVAGSSGSVNAANIGFAISAAQITSLAKAAIAAKG